MYDQGNIKVMETLHLRMYWDMVLQYEKSLKTFYHLGMSFTLIYLLRNSVIAACGGLGAEFTPCSHRAPGRM